MAIQAANKLLVAVSDAAATEDEIQSAAQSFFNAVNGSSPEDANEALRILSKAIAFEDLTRSGFVALICGALVEHGCDPSPIEEPLIGKVEMLAQRAAGLLCACIREMPPEKRNDEEGFEEAIEEAMERVRQSHEDEAEAWDALDQFWPPAIALFSVSPEARASFRAARKALEELADHHAGASWMNLILKVLDNEPILVIEPATRIGVQARMSGVADNFQLHVLLMDIFPHQGSVSPHRTPPQVAEVARGIGPQQAEDVVIGYWNLYTFQAIRADLTLPDPQDTSSSEHWIWGEGTPADIPEFEGHRVILLGPSSYARSWRSQRLFDYLPADIEIIHQLSADEVEECLKLMAASLESN